MLGSRRNPSPKEQALVVAVLQGNLAAAEELLLQGVSPNAKSTSGETMLQLSVHGANLEMTKLMLQYGGDPNAVNNDGVAALHFAIKPEMHRLLLENGADPSYTPKDGYSPFELFCTEKGTVMTEADKKQMMELLESQGIALTREHFERTSWLTHADLVEVVKVYQEFDYDINKTTNSRRELPLHVAAITDNYAMMNILIDAGAKANVRDAIQQTPLNIIASNKNSKHSSADFDKVLKALLRAGAEINEKDGNSNTPLCNAVMAGFPERVRLIVATPGVRVNEPCEYGETALFRAGNLQIAKHLVSAGADVNALSSGKNTPLFTVTNPEVVDFLIKSGANVNQVNMDSMNILVHNTSAAREMYYHTADEEAVNKRFLPKFELLIKAGIDINFEVKPRQTALSIAKQVPLDAFVELFERYGAKR
jgi:ankyrin repeat protein